MLEKTAGSIVRAANGRVAFGGKLRSNGEHYNVIPLSIKASARLVIVACCSGKYTYKMGTKRSLFLILVS